MPAATPARDTQIAAKRLLQAGRTRDAQQLLNAAIQQHPDRGEFWLLRGLARHAEANWIDALADLESAMTLIPLPEAGTLALGDCYSHTRHPELALVAYRHLLARPPLAPDTYAELYARFRASGRVDLALGACRAACEAEPENHNAIFAMAHCMAALGYSSQYIAGVLQMAVDLAPTRTVYRLSLVLELARAGRAHEAYDRLAAAPPEVLRLVPCHCAARRLLNLCVWADDAPRARILCRVLADQGAPPYESNLRVDGGAP